MSQDIQPHIGRALERMAQAMRAIATAGTEQDALVAKGQMLNARDQLNAAAREASEAIVVLSA
jgi:hypothetical protein